MIFIMTLRLPGMSIGALDAPSCMSSMMAFSPPLYTTKTPAKLPATTQLTNPSTTSKQWDLLQTLTLASYLPTIHFCCSRQKESHKKNTQTLERWHNSPSTVKALEDSQWIMTLMWMFTSFSVCRWWLITVTGEACAVTARRLVLGVMRITAGVLIVFKDSLKMIAISWSVYRPLLSL